MLFTGKDGELRLIEYANATTGVTRSYIEVLFCEMDLTMPIARPRTEENLIMDRGNADTNMHFIESNDEPRYAPIPLSFSCKLADTTDTRALTEWLSGVTEPHNALGGVTTIYSWDGATAIDSITLPSFVDSGKMTLRVQVLWDGTTDLGYQADQVYFLPNESTITESADRLTLSANGQIYGGVTRISAFSTTGSGVTYWPFV